MEGRNNIG